MKVAFTGEECRMVEGESHGPCAARCEDDHPYWVRRLGIGGRHVRGFFFEFGEAFEE